MHTCKRHRNFALTILLNNFVYTADHMIHKTKEEEILKAATHEFAIKGYDGARTSAIAARAGVTHAMLHYYFRTKEQLFDRIFENIFAQLCEMMTTVINQPGKTLPERIAAGVRAHFDFINSHREMPIFVINAINRDPERMKSMVKDIISSINQSLIIPLQPEIDAAVARGEIRQIDLRMTVINMVSLNLVPFISKPLVQTLLGVDDYEKFLAAKREENVRIIMNMIQCEQS